MDYFKTAQAGCRKYISLIAESSRRVAPKYRHRFTPRLRRSARHAIRRADLLALKGGG